MVVTIDGPSGAGKSTVSRRLARELGFAFLDTGALYRGVALGAQWDELDLSDLPVLEAWLTKLELSAHLQGGSFQVLLAGRDIEPFIRNEEIASLASQLSALGPVRAHLLTLQRQAGEQGDLVAEGRDMGTVVFPQAQLKIFLTAEVAERARRRYLELKPSRPELTPDQVRADLDQRDQRDQGRSLSPLLPAAEAHIVDTTHLGLEDVVALLARMVRAVQSGADPAKESL